MNEVDDWVFVDEDLPLLEKGCKFCSKTVDITLDNNKVTKGFFCYRDCTWHYDNGKK